MRACVRTPPRSSYEGGQQPKTTVRTAITLASLIHVPYYAKGNNCTSQKRSFIASYIVPGAPSFQLSMTTHIVILTFALMILLLLFVIWPQRGGGGREGEEEHARDAERARPGRLAASQLVAWRHLSQLASRGRIFKKAI